MLTTFLNSLQSYSTELVQHLQSGQKLCHYTDLPGAIGIITGDDLWLSSSRFSNDDEELSYGHRFVNEVLSQMEGDTNDDPQRPARLRRVREHISAIGSAEAADPVRPVGMHATLPALPSRRIHHRKRLANLAFTTTTLNTRIND